MQAVNQQHLTTDNQPVAAIRVSVEFVAYTVLIILAVLLRVADLDIVPMSDAEAQQALSAYQTFNPETPIVGPVAQSPIVYWLQVASFATVGGNEFAARLPGVLSGIVLMLLPLLFRERIGHERTFWLSVLLAFSPIAFAGARFADSTIWTIIFALAFFWAIWRYWDNRQTGDILLAAGFLGAMIFLTESGGIIFGLILVLAALVAIWWTIFDAPETRDTPGDEVIQSAREFMGSIPLQSVAIAFGATVVLGSTLFFINPSGLNIVAEVVRGAFTGFVQPYQADTPAMMAIVTLFVYDFWLIVLAIVAAVVLVVNRNANFVDRYAIAVMVMAFLFMLVYRGSRPAHALFVALPMLWLVARLIRELTINYAPLWYGYDGYDMRSDADGYWWIKWILGVVILGLLVMLNVHWLEIGRGILQLPSENILAALGEVRFATFKASMIWFIISLMFLIVGYFLAASIWGNINSLQGFGLGFVFFMLVTGIGTGWNTAVVHATNPYELWRNSAITNDAYLLRDTLLEIADRDSLGFPLIDLTILRDESAGITDDNLLAWLLRDFRNAVFVDTLDEVQRDEIVLMPLYEEDPDLGGSYVGQSFVIREHWSLGRLTPKGWISWLGQRRVQGEVSGRDRTILWLRIDVYDGIPASERIQG